MAVFKEYSQYYDLLYLDKNYDGEANYIADLITRFKPDAKSILELGCGTGKHAAILAENGYKIHAIDISKEMLNEAEKFADDNLVFDQGDVRFYRAHKKFDAVISLFHVASYQTTNQDLVNFFKTAQEHLEEGGIFIFDMWYGPAVMAQKPEERFKTLENDILKIERKAIPQIHYNKNVVDVKYEILVTKKSDLTQSKINELHEMRYLFLPEIEFFLENQGFKMVNAEEWLTKKEASCDSWGVCIVAKKQK